MVLHPTVLSHKNSKALALNTHPRRLSPTTNPSISRSILLLRNQACIHHIWCLSLIRRKKVTQRTRKLDVTNNRLRSKLRKSRTQLLQLYQACSKIRMQLHYHKQCRMQSNRCCTKSRCKRCHNSRSQCPCLKTNRHSNALLAYLQTSRGGSSETRRKRIKEHQQSLAGTIRCWA